MSPRDTKVLKRSKLFALFLICLCVFALLIPVSGALSSVVITDVEPTEFRPAETKEVVLTVKNNGGDDAKDITLEFKVENATYLSLVGPTVAHINTLNSWCSKEVPITVHAKEGTPTGVYSIPIDCTWYEYAFDPEYGRSVPLYIKTVDLGISFTVKGDIIINVGKVETAPSQVRPGDEDVVVQVMIWNTGDAAAKDVEAQLICNEQIKPSGSGTDREYLGWLNPGTGKLATFHVDLAAHMDAGSYPIPLYIVYKDTENVQYVIKGTLALLVKSKPEIEIASYYTEPTTISVGDHVLLHIRVQNVGSEKAESVSLRVTGEADVPFDFTVKTDHVGNLKVNETGDALLEFDVNNDAAKKIYRQGLEIRCTGDRDLGDDTVYIFDEEIQLEVTSSSSGSFSIPGCEALLFVLALLFTSVLFLKRKRR
jgi:hypothetical protein